MQNPVSSGCFFLDTVTILSEILEEFSPRINKFEKDVNFYGIRCYICNSVEEECNQKIDATSDFLGTVIREGVKIHLEESRERRGISLASPMTSEDVIALGDIFSLFHRAAKAGKLSLSNPIRIVEEWAVTFLGGKLKGGVRIEISDFLRQLLKRILAVTSSIQDPYDELVTFERNFAKKISVTVDPSVVNSVKSVGIHEPDATHLASAYGHQTSSNEKTVFVTVDYRTILFKKDDIKRLLNIMCCDPLYALYHLK